MMKIRGNLIDSHDRTLLVESIDLLGEAGGERLKKPVKGIGEKNAQETGGILSVIMKNVEQNKSWTHLNPCEEDSGITWWGGRKMMGELGGGGQRGRSVVGGGCDDGQSTTVLVGESLDDDEGEIASRKRSHGGGEAQSTDERGIVDRRAPNRLGPLSVRRRGSKGGTWFR
jgi:hypothetical protein